MFSLLGDTNVPHVSDSNLCHHGFKSDKYKFTQYGSGTGIWRNMEPTLKELSGASEEKHLDRIAF